MCAHKVTRACRAARCRPSRKVCAAHSRLQTSGLQELRCTALLGVRRSCRRGCARKHDGANACGLAEQRCSLMSFSALFCELASSSCLQLILLWQPTMSWLTTAARAGVSCMTGDARSGPRKSTAQASGSVERRTAKQPASGPLSVLDTNDAATGNGHTRSEPGSRDKDDPVDQTPQNSDSELDRLQALGALPGPSHEFDPDEGSPVDKQYALYFG